MEVKESVLRKVRILITNQFDSPEEALCFFDSKNEGRLKKHELKKMLRGAVENDFLRPRAASELLKGYDEASSVHLCFIIPSYWNTTFTILAIAHVTYGVVVR